MAELPKPAASNPYPGRGLAFRFHGLADLGPVPERVPVPPPAVTTAPPRSDVEGELPFLTIAEAGALFRTGKLSPVELTRALLARIERLNPLLNAYITVTAELALAQAREAEAEIRRGNYRGPLHGIPISLKDLIATAGVLTTGGTAALADWVPREDAFVWQCLREAGAVLLGKTNLHEMAAGSTNLNPFYGASRNPWNLERITGGSSGGSAAAVAGHLCLGSIGSDTGGSIRGPAALCGIVGLKPTFGRVSTRGAIFLSWTNDHLGPMTKTVEDAAILLNAIAAYDPLNPLAVPMPPEDYTAHLGDGLRGVNIAVPINYFWELQWPSEDESDSRIGPDPDTVKAVRAAIDVLKGLEANVVETTIEGLDELLMRQPAVAPPVERAFYLQDLPPERQERFSRRFREGNRRALEAPAVEYLANLERGYRLQTLLESALQPYDAFVVPTTPIVAPTIKAAEAAAQRAEEALAAAAAAGEPPPLVRERGPTAALLRYTGPFNRSGQPALTVPCGFSREGLPIGMMIIGKRFQEGMVLRIGHAYQQATEWHKRRPPLP